MGERLFDRGATVMTDDLQSILLDRVVLDHALQPRRELSLETIVRYTEEMSEGAQFPPVVVFDDGVQYLLADGFHRVSAARAWWKVGGPATIVASVRSGTRRDALLYACGANAAHGLPRSNADKNRVVELMLGDPEWVDWSDHKIARACGVDHKFVGNKRKALGLERDTRLVERGGTVFERRNPERPPLPPPSLHVVRELSDVPIPISLLHLLGDRLKHLSAPTLEDGQKLHLQFGEHALDLERSHGGWNICRYEMTKKKIVEVVRAAAVGPLAWEACNVCGQLRYEPPAPGWSVDPLAPTKACCLECLSKIAEDAVARRTAEQLAATEQEAPREWRAVHGTKTHLIPVRSEVALCGLAAMWVREKGQKPCPDCQRARGSSVEPAATPEPTKAKSKIPTPKAPKEPAPEPSPGVAYNSLPSADDASPAAADDAMPPELRRTWTVLTSVSESMGEALAKAEACWLSGVKQILGLARGGVRPLRPVDLQRLKAGESYDGDELLNGLRRLKRNLEEVTPYRQCGCPPERMGGAGGTVTGGQSTAYCLDCSGRGWLSRSEAQAAERRREQRVSEG